MIMANDSLEICSFCNKHKDSVGKLIVSDRVAICNECVNLCQELLEDTHPASAPKVQALDPRDIKNYLDQYVIGQHQAKMVLSVAIVNHFKRLQRTNDDIEVRKANILMIGPTGSGKTLLARTIARYLDIPMVTADATSLTEAGYVGDDVEMLISRLYAASGNDIQRTQRGIVFVDEIDKIARKSESTSITRDVSGEGVQQALLKLVEGTLCRITATGNRKHPAGDMLEIDTSDILFIAGGAFVGLAPIIQKRRSGSSMGFTNSIQQQSGSLTDVGADDLVTFGMIPEFVGRFPQIVALEDLTQQDLMAILTQVKNNWVDQYRWLFQQDDVNLEFTNEALALLADRAIANGTGARGLQHELEGILMPHMFNLSDYKQRGVNDVLIDHHQVNNPTAFKEIQ